MCEEGVRALAIQQRVLALEAEIRAHAMDPEHPPMLLPVTKTYPVSDIMALKAAGCKAIGENRVQEIVEKYPSVSADFDVHLIGRLQTNKIKYIMGRVQLVHSLDRMSLAQALSARAQAQAVCLPVLVEVNIGEENQKAGIPPEEAEAFVRACARLSGLRVCGLMAMMPMASDPEALRPLFRRMRMLRDHLRALAIDGTEIAELSMGMSGDWRVAAEEGATILRIGSAIFGRRTP